jgi:hypothetical protein
MQANPKDSCSFICNLSLTTWIASPFAPSQCSFPRIKLALLTNYQISRAIPVLSLTPVSISDPGTAVPWSLFQIPKMTGDDRCSGEDLRRCRDSVFALKHRLGHSTTRPDIAKPCSHQLVAHGMACDMMSRNAVVTGLMVGCDEMIVFGRCLGFEVYAPATSQATATD